MAKLSWNETYPFVRAAAKGQVDDQHNLWKAAAEYAHGQAQTSIVTK